MSLQYSAQAPAKQGQQNSVTQGAEHPIERNTFSLRMLKESWRVTDGAAYEALSLRSDEYALE